MKTMKHQCPACPCDEFEELETVIKGGTVKTIKDPKTGKDKAIRMNAGRYRVRCTCCGHVEVVVSRNPDEVPNQHEQFNAKRKYNP